MSQATQGQTIEQTLNKTDLGHTIYEHRKTLVVLLVAVVIASLGYVFWHQIQKNTALANSEKVFEFQSGIWADVKEGKKDITNLVKTFEDLDPKVQTAPVMLPVVLEMSKFLFNKGNYAEAEAILSKVSGAYDHPVSAFFASMQRAVVLEKLGKVDEAISVLEPLAQKKEALMPAKISVKLGRLYMEKGENDKARTQFEYVMSNYPNDDQAKVAKLYLSQLSK